LTDTSNATAYGLRVRTSWRGKEPSVPADADHYSFRFSVLGRYRTRIPSNDEHVTLNLASGRDGHLTYCGTLTMSVGEWDRFAAALRTGLGDDLIIET